jgi:hypothetical protein
LKLSRPVSSTFHATTGGMGGSAMLDSQVTTLRWCACRMSSRLAAWNRLIWWTCGQKSLGILQPVRVSMVLCVCVCVCLQIGGGWGGGSLQDVVTLGSVEQAHLVHLYEE